MSCTVKGKEETFKNYSGKDKDPGIQQQLRERQLDSETRTKWAMTSAKCESVGKVMAQLESKVYSFKQRSRHHKIPHSISLYSLRRTLRDIEKEVVNKDNVIHEIEEKLGNLQLDNNHKKAASRGKCYTLEDSDSDGEEQKMQSAQTSILTSNTPLPDKTIQTAARRLKLEYFLSGLCNAVDTVN
ncbi:hypothetical protein BDF14DRAFT_1808265 [Spinellus fusiger]|nr:hypothetical protein BDF14DRAFT_1808265 [Spinellus fusiger]